MPQINLNEQYWGKTPALGDHQARKLLDAPEGDTLKGKRDRAMLATLLYHALRREERERLVVPNVDDGHTRACILRLCGGLDGWYQHEWVSSLLLLLWVTVWSDCRK